MAKNIVQRISLEGGAAIKAQLEAIGASGKKAFNDLQGAVTSGRAFGGVGAAIDSVTAKANALGGAGRQLGNDLSNLGGTASKIAGVFGIGLAGSITGVVAGVAAMVRANASAETSLQKAADAAGISTTAFQELTFAAGKVNLEQDDITKVLTKINKIADDQVQKNLHVEQSQRNLNREFGRGELTLEGYSKGLRDIRDKANDEIDIFSRLGVSVFDASGHVKDSKTLLEEFADAIKQVPDAANRAGLALEITGNRNSKFNSLIAKGSEGLKVYKQEMDRVAPATTPLQIAVGNKLNGAFNGLKATIDSTKTAILTLFAPNETRLVSAFQQLIVDNREKLLSMAAAIADKVTPIVDDLIAVLQGRDADVKNNIILVIRDAIKNFVSDAGDAINNIIIPALKILLGILNTVAEAINGLFGTKLTGGQIAIAIIVAKAIGIFGLFSGAISVAVSAIGLLSAALGGPVVLAVAALAFAIGFVLVRALQGVNWKAFADFATKTWESIKSGVSAVGTFIANAFNTAATAVSDAWNTSVQFVKGLWDGLLAFFGSLPATVTGFFVSVGDAIVSAFNSAVETVKGYFDSLWQKITGIFTSIMDKARAAGAAISNAFGGNALGDQLGLGDIASNARGGMIRGKGTSRSDSILSWLSNGEFVMRADAVKKWGVGFMHALNAGLNPFQGFADGGFAHAMASVGPRGLPAFANGGVVSDGASLRPVIFQLDGRSFGTQMSEAAFTELSQFALTRRARSAGKKPNFVGA